MIVAGVDTVTDARGESFTETLRTPELCAYDGGMDDNDEDLLTTAQVAQLWNNSAEYITRLARLGRIPYVRKTKTGTYLFRPADVERRKKGPPSG